MKLVFINHYLHLLFIYFSPYYFCRSSKEKSFLIVLHIHKEISLYFISSHTCRIHKHAQVTMEQQKVHLASSSSASHWSNTSMTYTLVCEGGYRTKINRRDILSKSSSGSLQACSRSRLRISYQKKGTHLILLGFRFVPKCLNFTN